jgi:hypothetical protein
MTARFSHLSPGNQRHALDPLADRLDRQTALNPEGQVALLQDWWRRVDSNHRHRAYETPALPTELRRHGRSYDTSPEGGLAEDQRIIEKRTDGVKPRLASTAPCGRVADLRGRFSVAGATSYLSARSTAADNSGGPPSVRTRCRRRNRQTCGPTAPRRPTGRSNPTPWENQEPSCGFAQRTVPDRCHRLGNVKVAMAARVFEGEAEESSLPVPAAKREDTTPGQEAALEPSPSMGGVGVGCVADRTSSHDSSMYPPTGLHLVETAVPDAPGFER